MDTVIIPCYKRPEYLSVWMEILQKSRLADKQFYIFCLDHGFDSYYLKILENFPYPYGIVKTPYTRYRIGKQSFNVLNGLMVGAKHSSGLVHYIEEDVFISRDYFEFHQEIHRQQKDIFCSIATKNNNSRFKTDGYLQHYYLSDRPDYQALGSCFKKEMIYKIGTHFTNEYFENPVLYCRRHFPISVIGPYFVEQDGLIRRILEREKLKVAFPHVPRAFHGGIYGYNRDRFSVKKMKFEERVEFIKQTAFNLEKLKSFHKNPDYVNDSVPVDLDTSFDYLELVYTNPE